MSGTVHLGAARALPRPRAQTLLCIAIFALALGVRLYHLSQTSLWTDEFFTEFYPKAGLGFLWGQGMRLEPNPPLYYSLIWLWEHLFGESAFLLRVPSLIGSMTGIVLAGLLATELFGRWRSAAWAMLLLALCPTEIFYAQEARAYALQGAALALAMLGFARFLREPSNWAGLGRYAAGAAVAVWLHPTSVLAVVGFNVAVLAGQVGRAGLLRWTAANAAVVAACLPLLPGMLSPSAAGATGWIAPLDRWAALQVGGVTLFGPALSEHAMGLCEAGVAALAALVLLPPWRTSRRALLVLVLVPAVFLLLMLGLSFKKPMLISRTVAWVWIPLALVLGDVLAQRARVVGAAVLALFVVGAALHLARVDTLKEDWKGLLARLPDLGPPTLVVLAPTSSPAAVALYAPGAGRTVFVNDGLPDIVEMTVIPAMFGTERITTEQLRDAIRQGRPVWVLARRALVQWVEQQTAGLPPPKMVVTDTDAPTAMRAMRW